MEKIKNILLSTAALLLLGSCSDFLEVPPQGVVGEDDLKNV